MDLDELMFTPVGIAAGIAAGVVARFAFDRVWSLIDEEEPPEPEHRDVSLAKLATAGALEGAIFRVTRAVAEHGARRGFQRWTGAWPGEGRPEPK
jgi:hypothetical protein